MVNEFPKQFVVKLNALFGDKTESVIESYRTERLASFRVNTLVVQEKSAIEYLLELGFDLEKFGDHNAFILKNKSRRELTDLEEYRQGWFYIQSLSSMVPVWVVEREIREKIAESNDLLALDLCAAPGSKTSQMAAVMENQGKIVANDSNRDRIYKLKDVLKQEHIKNVEASLGHGEGLWRKYGPVFDFVLVDAPCSGEGRFNLNDSDSYSDWSTDKVVRLSEVQKKLLIGGVMCLKNGGTLIYSTCTLSPEENEEVVDAVLNKFGGAIEVESINIADIDSQSFAGGLTKWFKNTFDQRLDKSVRILPGKNFEGFFVCKIHRN